MISRKEGVPLKARLAESFRHFILALLTAVSLSVPAVHFLHVPRALPACILAEAMLFLLLIVLRLTPWLSRLGIGAAAAAAIFLIWQHMSLLQDFFQAVRLFALHGSGILLSLYADMFLFFCVLFIGFLSYAVTSRVSGAMPAGLVFVFLVLLVWQSREPRMLFCLIPQMIAVLVIFSLSLQPSAASKGVFPVALLLSLLCILAVPREGIGIPALQEASENLRQRIMDTLFFTEPRNVFSLSQEGYYPQGAGQLGGDVHPEDHLVMTVHTPRSVYLRGAIRNTYTGHTWTDTTGGRRYLWIASRWSTLRETTFDSALPLAEDILSPVTLSIHMEACSASSLFVPQRIRDLRVSGSLIPYFNLSSEVFVTHDLLPGDSWNVSALLYSADTPGMRELLQACALEDNTIPASVVRDYTALPDHLKEPLYTLAHQLSGTSGNPFDQAMALQTALQTGYRYTLSPAAIAPEEDFVSAFLFRTQEGYCTYFASAMTVLARAIGLPSRYVEGYVARPDSDGVAYVTGLQAHAWCEVYFPGFGWLTFDPTPGLGRDTLNPAGTSQNIPEASPDDTNANAPQATPTPTPVPEATPMPKGTETPDPSPASTPPELSQNPPDAPNRSAFPWWLLLLFLLLAALLLRLLIVMPPFMARHASSDEERCRIYLRAILQLLALFGVPREETQSLRQLNQLLQGEPPPLSEVCPVLDRAESLLYAQRTPQATDATALHAIYLRLYHALSVLRKIRFCARRALSPRSARML